MLPARAGPHLWPLFRIAQGRRRSPAPSCLLPPALAVGRLDADSGPPRYATAVAAFARGGGADFCSRTRAEDAAVRELAQLLVVPICRRGNLPPTAAPAHRIVLDRLRAAWS